MAANTTSPSAASPAAKIRKFAMAIRKAALRRQLCTIIAKPVANPANGLDRIALAAFLELGTEPTDVGLDDVGLGVEVIIPYALKKHRARDDFTCVPHQLF